jgi:CRP/FNR family transcriptional regulator, cyclic AMP receptor protein
VPLLEQHSWDEKDKAGVRLFDDLPPDIETSVRNAVVSGRGWEASVARHFLHSAGEKPAAEANHVEADMFSTLEKTILLKSVSLFQDIPAEKLARVAAIAEERNVPAGTLILREGDVGESLYVVVSGSVRIHSEDRELTVFHRGDCLGEMALLDSAPRSASATALEETVLLEIDQINFYQVMETYPEIMKEVVRLLTRRLRAANIKISSGK